MHSNIACHVSEVWYGNAHLREDKLLGEIGAQFALWEEPGSFNMEFILDGQAWEELKKLIHEADENYPKSRKKLH